MHPGTSLTDATRQWPSPNAGESRRGSDAEAQREGSPTLTGATAHWPTPTAIDDGTRGGRRRNPDGKGGRVLTEDAEHWPTPNVPNGGRTTGTSNYTEDGRKRQIDLGAAASHWPTPAARDFKGANGEDHLEAGTGRKHLDQLPNFVQHLWATPRAEDSESCGNHPGRGGDSLTGQIRTVWPTPYGSSQNGINGVGGEDERPSANTPSLERMSRSFLPDPPTENSGSGSSPSDPTSRQPSLWKTPHGFANMDATGKVADGTAATLQPAGDGTKITASSSKAKLNPQFVEWLMGFPIGWTHASSTASIDCARAEMAWFRCRLRWRLSSLLDGPGSSTTEGRSA